MDFEWDELKSATNRKKHGVSFDEASRAFDDPFAITEMDRIEAGEYRWQTIGMVGEATLLLVAHTDRDENGFEVIRIISARRANRKEKSRYGQDR